MTKVKYTITIHTARTDNRTYSKADVDYHNRPATAPFDRVSFLNQKIVIKAERNSKRLKIDDILEYKQSTLYIQIFKSILFLYLWKGKRVKIRSIEVCTPLKHEKRDLNRNGQPLSADFQISHAIPTSTLELLWEESVQGDNIRTIVTHFLRGLSSKDRYFKFERFWRAFEQAAYWRLYHGPFPKSPNGTNAMIQMRTYFCTRPAALNDIFTFVSRLSSRRVAKLHWRRFIDYSFPYSGSVNELNMLINRFLRSNEDVRLCRVYSKAIEMRQTGLNTHHLMATAEGVVQNYRATRVQNNDHVLCMLLCKYGFFMRNKMFHGQEADFTFCFTNHTEDDDITNFMNIVLEKTLTGLLIDYVNL